MKFNKDLKHSVLLLCVCVFFSNISTVEEAFQFANTNLFQERFKD